MRLDYGVPNYQLLIGAFDCTDYLDEISLSLPMHEIAQMLTWSGRFKVSYNRKAFTAGLLDGDFDPLVQPLRWRPAQAPVELRIKGYSLPVMRIDRYAYNPQTKTGEGTLVQILDVVATSRPSIRIGGATAGSGSGELANVITPVQSAVSRLISAAFFQASVIPTQALLGGLTGQIYGSVITSNPVPDAQKLAGTQWQWLGVDNQERITTTSGDPLDHPVLFSRAATEFEYEPDIDHLHFSAYRVIVTGSRQIPAKIACQENPAPIDPILDRKGRVKVQRVEEKQPFNRVYTKNGGDDISPTTSEVKWIFYQYPDDRDWDSQLLPLIPGNLIFERDNANNVDYNGAIDTPCQTVTIFQQPLGRIFSFQGNATTLQVAALEIQSEKRKGRWVPIGLLAPKAQKGNLTLSEERYERLQTAVNYPGQAAHSGTIDPKTGKAQCLEPLPKKEERQKLAELPLETVAVAGIATVLPANWTPIRRSDLIVEAGFLPSNGTAAILAERIATREARRRDSLKVEMPIPEEWLAAGCPALRRCYLADGTWLMDGLIISIQQQQATFAFSAARIDRLGVAVVSPLTELVIRVSPTISIEATVSPAPMNTPFVIRVPVIQGDPFIIRVPVVSGGGGG